MPSLPNHALVFGASGISGWSVVRELLTYPTEEAFASITGLTNRDYSTENQRHLPKSSRLKFVSGVDLTSEEEEIASKAKVITDFGKITHAFLFAYVHNPPSGHTLVTINFKLMHSMLLVLRVACPNVRHVVFQTGGKTYGHHLIGTAHELGHNDYSVPKAPLNEKEYYLPDPWLRDQIHYYRQMDLLIEEGKTSSWNWTQVIPDAIIGFSPMTNDMNMAKGLAIFLLMWKKINGPGSSIPFPGSKRGYNVISTLSDMQTVAHFLIWTSLHPKETSGQSYNISELTTFRWSERWPILAAKFGLKGVEPEITPLDLASWRKTHAKVWSDIASKNNLKIDNNVDALWPFVTAMLDLPHDRQLDNSKRTEAGFTEVGEGVESFVKNWTLLEHFKQLPKGSFVP